MKNFLSLLCLAGFITAANADTPVILSVPQNLTINAGSAAYFGITVSNAHSYYYQWTFDGTNIPGAYATNYYIANVTNQAGPHAVAVIVISSDLQTAITNSATLTVLQGTIVNFQISGFAGGPSNVVVELFDHDKPATVENFVHYKSSGAYSNLFFDRLVPGFVLQSGDYDATDRTNTTPGLSVIDINQRYVHGSVPNTNSPPLPWEIQNEFYVGPQVSNTKGTLALALPAGNPNGGGNAFFFNLVDNPILDTSETGGGPFTVFGRVIGGTDVLDYFNDTNNFATNAYPTNLVFAGNPFTNGIFDSIYIETNSTILTDLPENFHGTNLPANTNFFFIDFSFPDPNAQPVVDTTTPSAVITYPTANLLLTNGASLLVQGTAQDNVAVARVRISAQAAPGNGAYGGLAGGGDADGTTNWSYDFGVVEPGIYDVSATPQDGAGNLGSEVFQMNIIVTAVLTNGVGTVSLTNLSTGASVANAVGANMQTGTRYELVAHPGTNQLFVNWQGEGYNSLSPNINFTMQNNWVLTAAFITNSIPGAISFTYPAPRGTTTNGNFMFQGTITNRVTNTPVAITCQIYSYDTRSSLGSPIQTSGTTTWAAAETNNLAPGHYFVQAIATDSKGGTALITNDFTVLTRLSVSTNGRGTLSPNLNGSYLTNGIQYSIKATPATGSIFYSWSDGATATLNPVETFTMTPGLALTATFLSNNIPSKISFTSPAANAQLTNGTFNVTGKIVSSITATQILCQLFLHSNSIAPPVPASIGANQTTWSAAQTNLAPGSYTMLAQAYDTKGESTLIKESFNVLARVNLATSNGVGVISSNWHGNYLVVGQSYTIKVTPKTNYLFLDWIGGVTSYANPLTFAVTTNETIMANLVTNYFAHVSGTYNGLFMATNEPVSVSPTNSGYYTLTVANSGVFSGKLSFPGKSMTLAGIINPTNGFTGLYGPGLDGNYITNLLYLDLSNGTYSLTGVVYNGNWSSSLAAYRQAAKLTTNSAVVPGKYVLTIPGDHSAGNNYPGGDSYATYSIAANGAVTVAGSLADSTALTPSTTAVSQDGIWPFYYSLYSKKGILLGWQTNAVPANFAGTVAWSKPAKTGAYYTNAYDVVADSSTAKYIPPVKGTHYQIVFGGGTLTNAVTNQLTVSTAIQFTPDKGQTNKLTISLTPAGVVTGTFASPLRKTLTFHGAFASPSQGGSGYILEPNAETSYFEITALP
jgi:cyclophilin family peptidyl-prolyl cis-trans isomerase/uncharacterized protein (DUF2141 family)